VEYQFSQITLPLGARSNQSHWGEPLDKLDVARRQLGMASHIFIEDSDAVSVHTLVCASREILERICTAKSQPSILDQLAENASRPVSDLRRLANQYARALKHNKPNVNDTALLEGFTDRQNDFLLFIAWSDYRKLTGVMPIEAQAIYSWVEALYPEKMSILKDFSQIPTLEGIATLSRKLQKMRLQQTVVAAQRMGWLLKHDQTEKRDLVISSF
jgi:hypothetical protein